MDHYIKKLQGYSFSNKDMLDLVEGKTNLISYPQLKNYKNINQVLGKNKACIILYLSSPNYGHWTCIFLGANNTIEFFDPYSYKMDQQLNFNSPQKNYELGQDKPYLSMLVSKSKYKLINNPYRFQKLSDNNNVCGRWVGARLQFRNIPLKDFRDLFYKNKYYTPDWFVTILTSFIH